MPSTLATENLSGHEEAGMIADHRKGQAFLNSVRDRRLRLGVWNRCSCKGRPTTRTLSPRHRFRCLLRPVCCFLRLAASRRLGVVVGRSEIFQTAFNEARAVPLGPPFFGVTFRTEAYQASSGRNDSSEMAALEATVSPCATLSLPLRECVAGQVGVALQSRLQMTA